MVVLPTTEIIELKMLKVIVLFGKSIFVEYTY